MPSENARDLGFATGDEIMKTVQRTLPGFHDRLIESSIDTLRMFDPGEWWRSRADWYCSPYWGCFSGGKDSIVIKELARLAGVPVEWHYNVTTIDPPELVQFIRQHHPDVIFERPKRGCYAAVASRGMPTRQCRWCCDEFKESRAPRGTRLILGVRNAESASVA